MNYRHFFQRLRIPVIALTLMLGSLIPITNSACAPLQPKTLPLSTPLQPKTSPLSTPWTSQVSTTNPLPEYPRPQMVRRSWQNLNGQWQFVAVSSGQNPPFGQNLAETVLVPYPIESALSGIQRHENLMWYRKTFTVPSEWAKQHVILNFGAVSWQATVYVNGQKVGAHQGSYGSFSFDITDHLNGGTNELIVGVYAPVDGDGVNEPIGKQRLNPGGINYTASSGIWQTVWLEPVPAAYITRLDMTPDLAGRTLKLTVQGVGLNGQTVQATASTGGTQVGGATGRVGNDISIPVPNPHLWSTSDPFLYDLQVTLMNGSKAGDQVSSYFGMRSIGLAKVNGILRPVLNGKFIFQLGTLDQGFWPDGIYTAPTDNALKFDIQRQKDLGYTVIRKHVKVEPARWYYWADKIGMLVWQDMPAQFSSSPTTAVQTEFENELHEIVDQHLSSPSIILWIVFNEGWGQYDQARLADTVKGWDPSRLVDAMSGVNCCDAVDGGNGDVIDDHIYVGPGSPKPSATRFAALGEFGGLGLVVPGHQFANGFSYEMQLNANTLTTRYVGLIQQVQSLMTSQGLSAAIYTQFSDVESEINGLMTYDRQVLKMDRTSITNANAALIAASWQLN